MAKNFEDKLPRLWEAIANKLMDKHTFVNRLEELLREHGITEEKMILDVAGGYGFPSIELAKRGYPIVYNDASVSMFSCAIRNGELANAPGYLFALAGLKHGIGVVPWQEFNGFDDKIWDALICRGNSLPYVVSWGKENPDLKKARQSIKKGPLAVVDDDVFDITCTFKNDKKNRIRNWTIITKNTRTKKKKAYQSQGYLLLEDELVNSLRDVGFRKVEKRVLEGDMYEGFVAVK